MEPERRHRAKKSLGQNFLSDPNLQRKIVAALGAGPEDEVLEIGPGEGALTRHLVGRHHRLILVELDDALAGALAREFDTTPGVTVVHADILTVELDAFVEDVARLKVIGNIPYNITSPLIFRLLERPRPAEIVLMVQEEVAQRITARPGTKEYGALSIGVRTVAEVEFLFRVGRGAFRPRPAVDSAVVRIRPFAPPRLDPEAERRLRILVRAAFQWRRKQLGKILRDHPDLGWSEDVCRGAAEAVAVSLSDRPERLAPERWVALSTALPWP